MSYHIVDCRKARDQLQALAFGRFPLLLSLGIGAALNRGADADGTLTKSACIATTIAKSSLPLYTSTTACETGHLPQGAVGDLEHNHEGMDSTSTMLPHSQYMILLQPTIKAVMQSKKTKAIYSDKQTLNWDREPVGLMAECSIRLVDCSNP